MVRTLQALLGATLIAAATANMPVRTAVAGDQRPTDLQVSRIVEVRATLTVRNVTENEVRNLVLVVPPAVLDQTGTQRLVSVAYTTAPAALRNTEDGAEATYTVATIAPGDLLTFEQVYTVALGPDPTADTQVDPGRYLAAEVGIEAGHRQVKEAAQAATQGLRSATDRARAIAQYVVDHTAYDLSSPSRNQGALAALQSGTGVCSEYASLFVAMARASGVPSRLVYGWAKAGGLEAGLDAQTRHVWAEYYEPDQGWIAVDPTFAEAQTDPLAFDPASHLAQGWSPSTISASFGGRGLVTVVASHTLTSVTTAKR